MHSNLLGEEMAPNVQFLYCCANTVDGVQNIFLDDAAVASARNAKYSDALSLLAHHDIPFFFTMTNGISAPTSALLSWPGTAI